MLFDLAKVPPAEGYKLLVSTVVPRPIAWVTTVDAQGVVNAAPYSFFNAVASNPPIVAVGIGPKGSGVKDTGENIRATGEFVVNLVNQATAEGMNVTAIDFPAGVDELAEAQLTPVPSAKVRPPRIGESPVALECRTHTIVDVGHHAVVLGEVVAIHVADDCVLDAAKHYIDTPKLDLIGRMHGRGWYARTTDRLLLDRIALSDWQARKGRAAE
jgi:flavin reductase (DIM6/NTAB) family NADH-FMN oxidoreductase RutF